MGCCRLTIGEAGAMLTSEACGATAPSVLAEGGGEEVDGAAVVAAAAAWDDDDEVEDEEEEDEEDDEGELTLTALLVFMGVASLLLGLWLEWAGESA